MSGSNTRIAIVVEPNLPLGFLANTVATISIGIGAIDPELGNASLTDVKGRTVKTSSNCPVPILQASADTMKALLIKALPAPQGGFVVPFPSFARRLHLFEHYAGGFPQRNLAEEQIDGLGLIGPAKWVSSLTGSLKLLR
jgi:hypothetical protein